jgi:hypothetical protein
VKWWRRFLGPRTPVAAAARSTASRLVDIARRSSEGRTTELIRFEDVAGLVDALTDELATRHGIDASSALSILRLSMTLRCPTCGPLDPVALDLLYAAPSVGGLIGSRGVHSLVRGRCPGCGKSAVRVRIQLRGVKGWKPRAPD